MRIQYTRRAPQGGREPDQESLKPSRSVRQASRDELQFLFVVKTFADGDTQRLFATGKSRRLPADILRRARRKLEYIDLATRLNDLRVPRGNQLHRLKGDRKSQFAISISDQWRICFRFIDGDAYDVEITDYH